MEHSYAALLIAHLLVSESLPHTGNIKKITPQAWDDNHYVDDFIVYGNDGGVETKVYIASRLNANIGSSEKNIDFFARFAKAYLKHVSENRPEKPRLVLSTNWEANVSDIHIALRYAKQNPEGEYEQKIKDQGEAPSVLEALADLRKLYSKVLELLPEAPDLYTFMQCFHVERRAWGGVSPDQVEVQNKLDRFTREHPKAKKIEVSWVTGWYADFIRMPGEITRASMLEVLRENGKLPFLPPTQPVSTNGTMADSPAADSVEAIENQPLSDVAKILRWKRTIAIERDEQLKELRDFLAHEPREVRETLAAFICRSHESGSNLQVNYRSLMNALHNDDNANKFGAAVGDLEAATILHVDEDESVTLGSGDHKQAIKDLHRYFKETDKPTIYRIIRDKRWDQVFPRPKLRSTS